MIGENPRTTSDAYNSDLNDILFPADSNVAVPTVYVSGDPVRLANSIERYIGSSHFARDCPPFTRALGLEHSSLQAPRSDRCYGGERSLCCTRAGNLRRQMLRSQRLGVLFVLL